MQYNGESAFFAGYFDELLARNDTWRIWDDVTGGERRKRFSKNLRPPAPRNANLA